MKIEIFSIIMVYVFLLVFIILAVVLVRFLVKHYKETRKMKHEHNQLLHKIHGEFKKFNSK